MQRVGRHETETGGRNRGEDSLVFGSRWRIRSRWEKERAKSGRVGCYRGVFSLDLPQSINHSRSSEQLPVRSRSRYFTQ